MKVIVGSRDLWPVPVVASTILSIMASTDDEFAVRANRSGILSSGAEDLAWRIGDMIGRRVMKFKPANGDGNFQRDNWMVKEADKVYAFFAPGQFMEGGTGHVVACALRAGKPVEAYELDSAGNLVETATDEGDLKLPPVYDRYVYNERTR